MISFCPSGNISILNIFLFLKFKLYSELIVFICSDHSISFCMFQLSFRTCIIYLVRTCLCTYLTKMLPVFGAKLLLWALNVRFYKETLLEYLVSWCCCSKCSGYEQTEMLQTLFFLVQNEKLNFFSTCRLYPFSSDMLEHASSLR